jgi:hypothetical protein
MIKNLKFFYLLLISIFLTTNSLMANSLPNKKNTNFYAKIKASNLGAAPVLSSSSLCEDIMTEKGHGASSHF